MITYTTGNAADPRLRPAVIVHIVNDAGLWGAGFTKSLDARWPTAKDTYYRWGRARAHSGLTPFGLGEVALCDLEPGVAVAHLCAMRGVRSAHAPVPLRLPALESALMTLATGLGRLPADLTIHMPRIGTGLAGGHWDTIRPIVERELRDWPIWVYSF